MKIVRYMIHLLHPLQVKHGKEQGLEDHISSWRRSKQPPPAWSRSRGHPLESRFGVHSAHGCGRTHTPAGTDIAATQKQVNI